MRSVSLSGCVGLLFAAATVATVAPAPDAPVHAYKRWDTNELQTPPLATPTTTAAAGGEEGGSCSMRLRPSGQCSGPGDEDGGCPYKLTLPPLTIQLPKEFRMLERTVKELQSLKQTVRQMQSRCLKCQGGGGGSGAGGGVSSPPSGKTGSFGGQEELQQQQQEQQQQQQADQGCPGSDPQELPESSREEMREGCADGTTGAGAGGSGAPGHGSTTGKVPAQTSSNMIEMQVKLKKMSTSLRNARNQISVLHGRLEGLNLLNMDNVQAMVDRKVENITGMVNKLCSTCTAQRVLQGTPQFILAPRDCSEYVLEERKNGVYRVTPDIRNGTFEVFCDMESYGSGWTVIQQRVNGSVSFNRTWLEYKKGFGNLRGEFWLGNDHIHLLTKAKDMILRIELEDFEGVREYAKYDQFYVANEFLRYRLSVSGYSGTAGNAISFNKHFDHDQKFFTTPDRDNDQYPSGNCGAYYSSGWWFDACMSANLNGKYYHKRYKGVRNGIFWGTWHNMSTEYYPTNYRQAFKTVKMMIRPKNYAP
ncbi:unnamed protein product [Merluccius merluccius]